MVEVGVIEAPTFVPRALRFDSSLFNLTYAGGLDGLIGLRFIALDRYAIATVDVSTGELRTRATLDGGPINLLVDSEARRLYVSMWVDRYSYIEIRAYDLDSFELLGKTGPYSLPSGAWSLDSARHQLLIRYNSSYATFIGSLDANLSPKAFVDFRYLQFGQHSVGMAVMPSTVRNRTFAVPTQVPLRDNFCPANPHCPRGKAFLVALAADTLQPVTTVDLLQSSPVFQPEVLFPPVLLQPPPPPRPLASAVSDRRVQLTWRDPGDTTHFMVEVGTIPGRSNLGILHVGNVSTWSVDNVPSGTYYVRVRAGNYIGPSLPSNEVVVTVP